MASATTSVPWVSAEKIEESAAKLRAKYGVTSTPIDPYELATKMGVPVYQAEFQDESIAGAIRCRDGKPEILVRSGDILTRQAFTVAHELGHYTLHWKPCASDDPAANERSTFVDSDSELYRYGRYGPEDAEASDRDRRYRETQANMFAASLLMPADEVRSEWARHKDVKKLARRFKVSQEAMRFRLDRLELW
jgi:Zn-dependent peptidase ImmA (M78 family)